MSKQEQDILFFVAWCIEQYKAYKGIGGKSSMERLDRYGVLDYLAKNHEVLHTQSRQWLMEEIDEVIDERRKEVQV